MYRYAHNVDGFAETLAKVRKAVHKIFPRELSPTRLAEKYGADQKKKGAAKIAAVAAESEAHRAASDELLARQLAVINAAAPGIVAPSMLAPASQSPPAVRARVATANYAPWIIGGAALAGAALLLGGNRR